MSKKYYFWHKYEEKFAEVECYTTKVLFLDCVMVFKNPYDNPIDYEKWLTAEPFSGCIISRGDTKERAIKTKQVSNLQKATC